MSELLIPYETLDESRDLGTVVCSEDRTFVVIDVFVSAEFDARAAKFGRSHLGHMSRFVYRL